MFVHLFNFNYLILKLTSLQATWDGPSAPITGRIVEIIQDVSESISLVVLDTFSVSSLRHTIYGMPTLSRRLDEPRVLILPSTVSRISIIIT